MRYRKTDGRDALAGAAEETFTSGALRGESHSRIVIIEYSQQCDTMTQKYNHATGENATDGVQQNQVF
jgi:hypothetical protein